MMAEDPATAGFASWDWLGRPLLLTPGRANLQALGAAGGGLRLFAGGGAVDAGYSIEDGIATIPVHDVLGQASYRRLQNALARAGDDIHVKGIVLDIDSPGGAMAGAVETAEVAREASSIKPVVAHINSLAGSGAYVIAAGAPEIVATPSASLGSIGVVWLHLDRSAAMATRGVRATLLFAGAYKTDGNAFQPLDPEARARIGGQIAAVYSLIVESIGKHRPRLGAAGARKTDAAVYFGARAVEAGLADRIGSLADVLGSLKSRRPTARMEGVTRPALTAPSPPAPLPRAAGEGGAAAPVEVETAALKAIGGRGARALDAAAENGVAPEQREAWVEQFIAGANAARSRVGAILGCEGAKSRETLARRLAFDTDLTADQAIAALAAAPPERAQAPVKARPEWPVYATVAEMNEAQARLGNHGCTVRGR